MLLLLVDTQILNLRVFICVRSRQFDHVCVCVCVRACMRMCGRFARVGVCLRASNNIVFTLVHVIIFFWEKLGSGIKKEKPA